MSEKQPSIWSEGKYEAMVQGMFFGAVLMYLLLIFVILPPRTESLRDRVIECVNDKSTENDMIGCISMEFREETP